MPAIKYISKEFSPATRQIIEQARDICEQYEAQGFDLTLRQLYYQFVSRGLIPNKDTEYKRLGSIINDARLTGKLDWDYIVDRTRNVRSLSHWPTPGSIIGSAATSYRRDKWRQQPYYCEVWIEKDALIGVIEGVCDELDVPYFSCRGYTSQSEIWSAAQRIMQRCDDQKKPIIFHLGDHDPSGIDMTRDITDRLALFIEHDGFEAPEIRRLALNWEQVEQYNPPPNPAKLTDSRAAGYMKLYGDESWELDALEPTVMAALIRTAIGEIRDDDAWEEEAKAEQEERAGLQKASANWSRVMAFLRNGDGR